MSVKHASGKQRWDFVPFDALNEVVKTYTWGHDVKKYPPENWKTVEPDRYFAAIHRHLTETELRDETNKSIWEEHHKTRMEEIEDENT